MATRNVARKVVVDTEQRTHLEALAASRTLPHAVVTRARIILMAAEGVQNITIAEAVGLTRLSASKWRSRFVEHGMQGLHDELRPERPRSIDDERIAELLNKTLKQRPENATRWSTRLIADDHRRCAGLTRHPLQPCCRRTDDVVKTSATEMP